MSDFEERLRIQIDKEESNEIAKLRVDNEEMNSHQPFEACSYLSNAKRYIDIRLPVTGERISSGAILVLTIGNEIIEGLIAGVEKRDWQYVSVFISYEEEGKDFYKKAGKRKNKRNTTNTKYPQYPKYAKCTRCDVKFNDKPYESMRNALYNLSLIEKGAYDAIRGVHSYIPKRVKNKVSFKILREMPREIKEIEKSAILSSLTQNLTVVTVKIYRDYVGWYKFG